MPTITFEVSPCGVCGKMVPTISRWECRRCGRLACMPCTKKSTTYGGICFDCLPTLNPFQQQLMAEENKSYDKLYYRYAVNPKKNREWRETWGWDKFIPLPESPQVQWQQQGVLQAQATQQAHDDAVQLETMGGYNEDGKWQQGTLKLTNARFEFVSKKANLTIPLGDIALASIGKKGNLFDVQTKDGTIRNFRAEKGKLWAERIGAAMPK